MKFHSIAALALGLLGSVAAAQAQTTHLITFDAGDPIGGLAAGEVLGNQYAALGVTFSANPRSGINPATGNPWATNTDMSIVDTSGYGDDYMGTPALISGNALHDPSAWYFDEDGDASFAIDFSTSVTSFGIDVGPLQIGSNASITLYNGNTMIGMVGGGNVTTGQVHLSFSAASITRVVVQMGTFQDYALVDNISFTTAAAVPEPASWMSLGLGLAAMGWLARSRRGRQG